ncbi:MAG: DUF2155 domain-containing protein [Erythrobacter sp.]
MRIAAILLASVMLAACGQDAAEPAAEAEPAASETAAPAAEPEEEASANDAAESDTPTEDAAADAQIGTPMEERVATIGLLNKRNNLSQDIELKPGEEQTIGDVVLRLSACERTAPWEMPQETGAFVQVSVKERGAEGFTRIFSGWLFKESPSVNVVEHPIYDVWVKDCAMRFPGEEAASGSSSSSSSSEE